MNNETVKIIEKPGKRMHDRGNQKKENIKKTIPLFLVLTIWVSLTMFTWLKPADAESLHERRALDRLPAFTMKTVLNGQYMKDFEEYSKDQFPMRFTFRTIKSYIRYYAFLQKDNNNIYIQDGYASKIEYPMKETSINNATKKFRQLYDKYLKDTDTKNYISIIPDKNYFLADANRYPSMDYERLFELVKQGTTFARYIDITDTLKLEDYYKTDTHWKQEYITQTAIKLAKYMGTDKFLQQQYEIKDAGIDFYGVFYGQAALPLSPEKLNYLTNDATSNSRVYNIETNGYTDVYNMEGLKGRDPYDMFLSGAAALLVVENPDSKSDRELIIFRDSFGSSIAPLLLEGYKKVTLVDIRYIQSDFIDNFVEFDNQDVLFLYSALILNSSASFK